MRWVNRVVDLTFERPEDLLAHPLNPRRHPGRQRDAIRASLAELGFAAPVIVNRQTEHVLDGHLRVEEAISADLPSVPVVWVEFSEAEESVFLAVFDPITNLARYDQDRLDELLGSLALESEALNTMLDELAAGATRIDAEPVVAFDEGLRDVKTVVLSMTEEQYGELWRVLRAVPGDTTTDKVLHLARHYRP